MKLKYASSLVAIVLSLMICNIGIANQIPEIYINNQKINSDVSPIIDPQSNRVLIPMRAIFESLGATVSWDAASQSVTATKTGIDLVLTVGSNTAYKNGQEIKLDVIPRIINGRFFIPARVVGENLEKDVKWDGSKNRVDINDKGGIQNLNNSIHSQMPIIQQSNEIIRNTDDPNYIDTTSSAAKSPLNERYSGIINAMDGILIDSYKDNTISVYIGTGWKNIWVTFTRADKQHCLEEKVKKIKNAKAYVNLKDGDNITVKILKYPTAIVNDQSNLTIDEFTLIW